MFSKLKYLWINLNRQSFAIKIMTCEHHEPLINRLTCAHFKNVNCMVTRGNF
jgi:hypothetical protein